MNLRPAHWLALVLLSTASVAAPVLVADLRVRPDPNQVVASRLAGAWEIAPDLDERLGVKPTLERLEFTPDESVLAGIPAELTTKIQSERIWQAGVLSYTERGQEHRGPYLLITYTGNPTVVTFRSRDGQKLDDAESLLLTLVPARETAADLLFAGGDKNNEPFRAYRRFQAR